MEKKQKKPRDKFVRRVLVSTVPARGNPRKADMQITTFDPMNLTLETWSGTAWEFEGYYSTLKSAVQGMVDYRGKNALPGQILEAIKNTVKEVMGAIK